MNRSRVSISSGGTDIEPLPVREGDIIDLGGVALKIYETPGHSNCSISAYEPDAGILFASDAIGIPFSDKLFPAMNTNIDQFLNSLEKLRPLKVNLFCADHYGYITGEEAETSGLRNHRRSIEMESAPVRNLQAQRPRHRRCRQGDHLFLLSGNARLLYRPGNPRRCFQTDIQVYREDLATGDVDRLLA